MHVFIWEKNTLQRQNLQRIFEDDKHQVKLCTGYQDLRTKLKPLLQAPCLLVVNTNALNSLRQLYLLHRYAPYLNILAICPRQDSQSHLDTLRAGADACLTQPFSAELILAQSHTLQRHSTRLLRAKLEKNSNREILEDFTFDFGDYQVCHQRGEQSVSLALNKREFLLFHYLLKHKNQVHSRKKLYPIIFPGKTATGSRQIDNLIVALKKKLPPDQVAIESYYGEGYRLTRYP